MTFLGLTRAFGGDGSVAYCDFVGLSKRRSLTVNGRFTWEEISGNVTRVNGNCITGFDDPDINDYTFCLEDKYGGIIFDLSENIHKCVEVVSPGITPYQEDFKNGIMKPANIINSRFVIRCKDEKIGYGLVKRA
ncbi:4532_t:CDS:1 [Cetraspora pellucida]|uniref:4532_t:CDS:1 n=1 Tax=Cetraspora pellucida TaxID=1433469 RepID=A0A9N9ELL8_9GLOM|nr:4532_t:CDS:1 [Cetraspora pellucida]